MTTYILAGGADRSHSSFMEDVARVVSMKVAKPRVLGVWFSGDEERASRRFPEFRDYILSHFPTGSNYERAEHDRFLDQVERSDVIYFHGGSSAALMSAMERYGSIEAVMKDKIVIGSSAGAAYLADYYWSPTRYEIGRGSSTLDVAVVAHYGSPGFNEMTFEPGYWERAAKLVREASGKDEVLLLPEGTFAVIEK